jgi:hypothetical protein
MHVLMENVMKQLLELWDGSFKSQTMLGNKNSRHTQPYVLSKQSLKQIDAIVTNSSKLIPSQMSGTLTAISSRWRWTADTHLFFLLTLGPIVLKEHLPAAYFDHFLDLSELTKIMVALSVHRSTHVPFLRDGLRRWIARFDR